MSSSAPISVNNASSASNSASVDVSPSSSSSSPSSSSSSSSSSASLQESSAPPVALSIASIGAELNEEKSPAPAGAASGAAPGGELSANVIVKSLPIICFWILMSCSVILFNKYLYASYFPHPLTLTSIHMLFASLATLFLRYAGYLESPAFGWGPWMKTVPPIALLYAASLSTSNLGAARLSVSFVQMIKALTPLVSLAAGVALGVEQAKKTQAVLVLIMCVGVIVASYGEILWDTLGVAFQVTSVAAEGTRLILTQVLLQQQLPKGTSPLVSLSVFAPPCFLLLAPIALTFEPEALPKLAEVGMALLILLNTLTAFVLNISVILLLASAGGLIMTLAGIVKDILLIIASTFIFSNPVTGTQVCGYALALLGLNAFNEYKSRAKEAPTPLDLLKLSLSNRQALIIYVGTLVLFGVSARSLVVWNAEQSELASLEAQKIAQANEEAAARLLLTNM